MNRNRIQLFFLIAISITFLTPIGAFADLGLSGNWKLNKKDSDDPHQEFQEAFKKEHGDDHSHHGGMQREHGEGGGFHGGGHGPHGDPQDRMKAAEELTIEYTPPEFKITDKEGTARIFFTDGRETESESPDKKLVKATAKIDGDQIIVESSTRDGGTMTDTYYLSPDAARLYVKSRMKPMMLDEPVTFVRVYDRNPPLKDTNPSPN